MGLTSALFGGKLRTVLVALVFVAAVVGATFATEITSAPSVDRVGNRFGGVNETTTIIKTDLYASNPNLLPANLSGFAVDYGVEMNGTRMATGEKEGVSVGQGTVAVSLWTTLENECIPEQWVSHVQSDEHTDPTVNATTFSKMLGRTLEAPEITRSIDTDLLSAFNSTETSEINAEPSVVSDSVLYVNETRAEQGEPTDERTTLELTFIVHNLKPYPVAVSELGYDIPMNGMAVGEGIMNSEYVISPRPTEIIEVTTHIQNDRLDEWWVTHPERDQTTDLYIDFYVNPDAGGTTLRVPLDLLTYEKAFETDIFGSKAASDGSETTDEPMATEAIGATETAESEIAISTATTTSTAAMTATTATTLPSDDGITTTDDGLL